MPRVKRWKVPPPAGSPFDSPAAARPPAARRGLVGCLGSAIVVALLALVVAPVAAIAVAGFGHLVVWAWGWL